MSGHTDSATMGLVVGRLRAVDGCGWRDQGFGFFSGPMGPGPPPKVGRVLVPCC